MSDARAAVLGRIRAALGPAPHVPDVPRDYRAAGAAPAGPGVVDRFAERVDDYRATVHRTDPAGVDAVVEALLAGAAFVAAPGIAVPGTAVRDDPPLSTAALDRLDAVVTGCAVAIAETGTIVLDGGAASGRRALTLIPDHHVCLVPAEAIVPDVPDAIAALRPAIDAGRPLTLVSGPSATSDIELERVEGVHGPRRLDVVIVE